MKPKATSPTAEWAERRTARARASGSRACRPFPIVVLPRSMSWESSPEGLVVALCTVPDAEVAERIARAVVSEELAACVNVIPAVVSYYRWKGELCEDAELLLVAKTKAARAEELAARIRKDHPYENPEVITLPITGGLSAYLGWVRASVAGG